jgi:YD repeat-containing protein
MITLQKFARNALGIAAIATVTACANTGGLGEILGSVLGGGQNGQVAGTVLSVDTRNQIVNLRQSNGQTLALTYDSQTQVVYQNRNYAVTDLENGDQVTATVQTVNNGYYVSRVEVTQSGTATGTPANAQSVQGTVRQVDVNNGWFTVQTSNSGTITVTMPYNPTRTDLTKFQNLRSGDFVRLYGTYLNSTRVELVNFY